MNQFKNKSVYFFLLFSSDKCLKMSFLVMVPNTRLFQKDIFIDLEF